jgi:hypothetical protein
MAIHRYIGYNLGGYDVVYMKHYYIYSSLLTMERGKKQNHELLAEKFTFETPVPMSNGPISISTLE